MTPYREAPAARAKPAPIPCPAAIARRSSGLAGLPLGVLAISFFVPAVRSCDEVVSAFDESKEQLKTAVWAVPPYAVAAAFAGLTLVACIRGRSPSAGTALFGAGLLLAGLASSLSVPLSIFRESSPSDLSLAIAMLCAVAVALCVVLVIRALRKRGYVAWFGLLGAHALLAAPLGIFLGVFGSHGDLRLGGYLYELGFLALVAIQISGLVRVRRSRLHRKARREERP